MRRLGRLAGPAVAAAIVTLATAAPAFAKVGPFSIEVAPDSPTAGEAFEITVRCWHDLVHTDPARCGSMGPWFKGFLWAVPADPDRPEAEALPIELARRGRVLRASIVLTSPGTWHLCVWAVSPCEAEGDPGYPSRLEVLVLDARSATTPVEEGSLRTSTAPSGSADGVGGTPAPVAAAAVLAVVLAGMFGVRRSRRR